LIPFRPIAIRIGLHDPCGMDYSFQKCPLPC
jgi:hypothetical protein